MKLLRKTVSVILALCLTLQCTTFAFAETTDDEAAQDDNPIVTSTVDDDSTPAADTELPSPVFEDKIPLETIAGGANEQI